MRVELNVPGKPVAKGRPRAQGRLIYVDGKPRCMVHIHTPDTTAEQEAKIAEVARANWPGEPLRGPVRLLVVSTFEPPTSWPKRFREAAAQGLVPHMGKPDWDNLGKVTDALNGIAWTEDSHVVDGRSVKRYGSPARVEIFVDDASFEGMILPPEPKRPAKPATEPGADKRPPLRKARKAAPRKAPAVPTSLAIGKRLR